MAKSKKFICVRCGCEFAVPQEVYISWVKMFCPICKSLRVEEVEE